MSMINGAAQWRRSSMGSRSSGFSRRSSESFILSGKANDPNDQYDNLFGYLPSRLTRLKDGWLHLRMDGEDFLIHRGVLTATTLYLAVPAVNRVASKIRFGDVLAVTKVDAEGSGADLEVVEDGKSDKASSYIKIQVGLEGHNDFRYVLLCCEDPKELDDWYEKLSTAWRNHIDPYRNQHRTALHFLRVRVKDFYHTSIIQTLFAFMIFGNFIVNAVESEVRPAVGTSEYKTLRTFELMFTIIFSVEVILNIFSYEKSIKEYFKSSWNLFDAVVVLCSILALALDNIPELGILRIIRAFRLIRLFGRLQTLRRITNALMGSWLPVVNAMTVVAITTAVYAILGTTFFADQSPKHFGSFSKSMITMFTVITFDGWVDMMWDDMIGSDQDQLPSGVIIYFVSFIVIVVWTMLSVVVAIMLDSFSASSERQEVEPRPNGNLDPLLVELACFKNKEDLNKRIYSIYSACNVEQLHSISRLAFCDALRKFKEHPVKVTHEDWDRITQDGKLCNSEGEVGYPQLVKIFHLQLMDMIQERSAQEMVTKGLNHKSLDGPALFLSFFKILQLNQEPINLISQQHAMMAQISSPSMTKRGSVTTSQSRQGSVRSQANAATAAINSVEHSESSSKSLEITVTGMDKRLRRLEDMIEMLVLRSEGVDHGSYFGEAPMLSHGSDSGVAASHERRGRSAVACGRVASRMRKSGSPLGSRERKGRSPENQKSRNSSSKSPEDPNRAESPPRLRKKGTAFSVYKPGVKEKHGSMIQISRSLRGSNSSGCTFDTSDPPCRGGSNASARRRRYSWCSGPDSPSMNLIIDPSASANTSSPDVPSAEEGPGPTLHIKSSTEKGSSQARQSDCPQPDRFVTGASIHGQSGVSTQAANAAHSDPQHSCISQTPAPVPRTALAALVHSSVRDKQGKVSQDCRSKQEDGGLGSGLSGCTTVTTGEKSASELTDTTTASSTLSGMGRWRHMSDYEAEELGVHGGAGEEAAESYFMELIEAESEGGY